MKSSDLEDEDDEEWRNWQFDDPDPDSWDAANADGEQTITHAFLLC